MSHMGFCIHVFFLNVCLISNNKTKISFPNSQTYSSNLAAWEKSDFSFHGLTPISKAYFHGDIYAHASFFRI